jgi:hypothetical protein
MQGFSYKLGDFWIRAGPLYVNDVLKAHTLEVGAQLSVISSANHVSSLLGFWRFGIGSVRRRWP